MNFEPQKFFIGLVDFFSILLPGALLTYLAKNDVGPLLLGQEAYKNLTGTEGWIVFAFCAYLLGHFVFLIGAWLLDERLYDPIRTATYNGQIERLAKGKKLPWRLTKFFSRKLIKDNADLAVKQAERIKYRYLDHQKASSAINAFQWCKAKLTLENPAAMATIQRFEADSKFFRSLVIVLLILILLGLFGKHSVVAAVSLPLIVLAIWRYVDQRLKSTTQAYWYIITIEGNKDDASRQQSSTQTNKPSHAGGVVFRKNGDQVEYLLVQAKKKPDEWVLPKGHIEPGERMEETAVREVREETGVWARIISELGIVSFTVSNESVNVQFYLMEALKEEKPSERRKTDWKPLQEAVGQVKHNESKDLLELAEQKHIELEQRNKVPRY